MHMVKRLRFLENRTGSRRRPPEPTGKWVFEAIDVALVMVIAAVMIWLQWFVQTLPD